MKDIEKLLCRYQEGGLSPDELAELNRLTHRESVMEAAFKQARAIKVRRYSIVAGVAVVLAVAGTVFHAQSGLGDATEMPIVAQAEVPKPYEVVEVPETTNVSQTKEPKAVSDVVVRSHDTAVISPKPQLAPVATVEPTVEAIVEQHEPSVVATEPIVACNTECSPDSVINDIWKFLRT